MIFLAGWKFDEAGYFGVGLLHYKVKGLPIFCYICICSITFSSSYAFFCIFFFVNRFFCFFFIFFPFVFLLLSSDRLVWPGRGGYPARKRRFIFRYGHGLQVGEDFFPEKVLDKLLVKRFHMSVLVEDDVDSCAGQVVVSLRKCVHGRPAGGLLRG